MKLTAEQQRKAEENMGLVGKVIADKVHGTYFGSYTREDLFQIGCIGLCKAAATDKGGCFSTYAYRLIWNEICNALVAATQRENKELVQEDLFWDRQEAPADTQAVLELKTLLDRTAQSVTGVAAKGIQAIRLRLEHPEAQIIAGGTDVLVQMREGKRAGKALISIQGCREMRGVSLDEEENLRIGSLTTFSHITADPLIQLYINVLGEAVDMVGGPQIRNAGTIGGNTCNGVTSADSASTLHAWEAIVEITGKNGVRRVPIKDFYLKAGTVDLRAEEGEIQTAILIPKASYDRTFGHYIKYAMRNAMDIATLGTSVNARLSPDKKTFERVRIAFGVAGPVPLRALNAEAFINGREVTLENIQQFGRMVLEDIHPRDSWRASKAFRSHIAVESAKRCLMESVKLAGGEL